MEETNNKFGTPNKFLVTTFIMFCIYILIESSFNWLSYDTFDAIERSLSLIVSLLSLLAKAVEFILPFFIVIAGIYLLKKVNETKTVPRWYLISTVIIGAFYLAVSLLIAYWQIFVINKYWKGFSFTNSLHGTISIITVLSSLVLLIYLSIKKYDIKTRIAVFLIFTYSGLYSIYMTYSISNILFGKLYDILGNEIVNISSDLLFIFGYVFVVGYLLQNLKLKEDGVTNDIPKKWYLIPLMFNVIGGIICYFNLRKANRGNAKYLLYLGIIVLLTILWIYPKIRLIFS